MNNPYFLKPYPEKTCSRCLFTDDIAKIDPHSTECEYCQLSDAMIKKGDYDWQIQLNKIKSPKKKYDCLIGISGGLDSSTILYMAVKVWGLRPLVMHMDNHYNSPQAEHNMKMLIQKLNVDAIRFNIKKDEYDKINEAFLESGTPDLDIPNDVAMSKLSLQIANQYGIKYILNGHSVYTEGSTPRLWTRIDSKYLQSVYEWHTGKKITNFPVLTIWDQIYYGLKGIQQISPFHNKDVDAVRNHYEKEMIEYIGWQSYGGKHAENIYTEFVGSWLLPSKFGIDKRKVYLSAQVRNGRMKKKDAIEKLLTPPEFDLSKLPEAIYEHISPTIYDRNHFKQYNFKKYRIVFWILMKLRVVPLTMFRKYC